MITRVQVSGYRCLNYVDARLGRLNVLVGPNASGKTTFLDALLFLGDLIETGPLNAVKSRTRDVLDIFHNRTGDHFDIAIEVEIPDLQRSKLPEPFPLARYEVSVGFSGENEELGVLGERLVLLNSSPNTPAESLFEYIAPGEGVIYRQNARFRNARTVIHKSPDGKDKLYHETLPNKGKGWIPTFEFGRERLALTMIPGVDRFPIAVWLRDFLTTRVVRFVLNSDAIRQPSPPGMKTELALDGSNLPWVIERLEHKSPERFSKWIRHIQTALDIDTIKVTERPENRSKYLTVRYRNGVELPSWSVSDGTLRFFALTVLAYLDEKDRVYLIEEPENGIHPRAVEPVFDSLSSIYSSQLLLATHSPIVLGLVNQSDLLCFQRQDGQIRAVPGSRHPHLAEWKGDVSLGMMFAAGILD